jgi:hypothetical protein
MPTALALPALAGRHQLIAICVHEEQKMEATLTSLIEAEVQ